MTLVSRYPFSTAVNWPQHGCPIPSFTQILLKCAICIRLHEGVDVRTDILRTDDFLRTKISSKHRLPYFLIHGARLLKWTNWSNYHKHRLQLKFGENQISETSQSIETKQNRKQYCTVPFSTLNAVRQVMFFNVKIEKFVGGTFLHFQCLACWVVELQMSV